MNRNRLPLLLLTAASLGLAACAGSKRPPVLSTTPVGAEEGSEEVGGRPRSQPLDTGPDVQPLPAEGALGEDFSGEELSGEGGPLADIHFAYDSAALSEEARATLEKHALWLQSQRDVRVTLEGHCDERGTVEYNLALGEQRARAAHDYLVGLGVAAERLKTVSYGKERPLDPASNEQAWARNRRVHCRVTR